MTNAIRKPRSDKGVPRGTRSENDSRVYAFRLYSGQVRDWLDQAAESIANERNIPFSSALREVISELVYAIYPDLRPYTSVQPASYDEDLRYQLEQLQQQFYAFAQQNKYRTVEVPAAFEGSPVTDVDGVGDDLIDNILAGMSDG
jgi:hypothetical protein